MMETTKTQLTINGVKIQLQICDECLNPKYQQTDISQNINSLCPICNKLTVKKK